MLGLASPRAGGSVAYVDLDAVIASHPLHGQLQAMQDQIAVLQQESTAVPTGMNQQQTAAYDSLQRELADAQAKFTQDLAQRRAYYQQREIAAINQLQTQVLGARPDSAGVLGGLRQQYGEQATQLQKQALQTLTNYRNELFRQDSEHLKAVQGLIAQNVRAKVGQKQSQLSSAETKYQIELVRADQEQRLNLQAKLQNIALTDKERADDTTQLRAIDAREQANINSLKQRDNAELSQLEKQLQAQAAAKYNAERTATQKATQAKLLARQRELQTTIGPQMQALGGKFQQQLNQANQQLAGNAQYQAQAQTVHNQMASGYAAEANRASDAYSTVRKSLVAKYSDIAHMQFADNEAIVEQAGKIAADRRDLYQKIADQVRAQVQQIAQHDSIAVVFENVRGAGLAVDLTEQVKKAVNSLPGASAAPASTVSRGT
jgi:hypothetical protein